MTAMMSQIEDLNLVRPRLRLVGGTEFAPEEAPAPRLETITSLQLEKVRMLCDIAVDHNVACFDDPAPAFAAELARHLGLGAASLETAFLGALLRDIGNLRVSRRVLLGLRFMTEHQRQFVRMHAEYSGQICEALGLPEAVAEAARNHHERWDGSGYLRGLRGGEVSLEARIVALVDAYDFMTRPRPGRKGLSEARALRELRRHSGRLFDPDLVEAWADVLGRGRAGRSAAGA
jgi:HD-GYP domain-containing protein (c-di-GMP phosphodiesterase class II)